MAINPWKLGETEEDFSFHSPWIRHWNEVELIIQGQLECVEGWRNIQRKIDA